MKVYTSVKIIETLTSLGIVLNTATRGTFLLYEGIQYILDGVFYDGSSCREAILSVKKSDGVAYVLEIHGKKKSDGQIRGTIREVSLNIYLDLIQDVSFDYHEHCECDDYYDWVESGQWVSYKKYLKRKKIKGKVS